MSWYLEVMKNYAGFSGRARRKEYWMFTLFNVIIGIIVELLDLMIGIFPVLTIVYGLAIFLPSLAVTIRRLHDTGRSGWWYLINFVPFVGSIILLVFLCLDSEDSPNRHGDNPKASVAA